MEVYGLDGGLLEEHLGDEHVVPGLTQVLDVAKHALLPTQQLQTQQVIGGGSQDVI